MPTETKTATRPWGHILLSILLAIALVMPAFPLSAVIPAYAAPAPEATGTVEDAADEALTDDPSLATIPPERISAVLPLDGSTVDAQGIITAGEGGPLAPQKIEETCGNCLDEDGTLVAEEIARQEEEDRAAEEAVAQLPEITEEDIDAAVKRDEERQQGEATPDPSLSDEDLIVHQTDAEQPASQALRAKNASGGVVLFG